MASGRNDNCNHGWMILRHLALKSFEEKEKVYEYGEVYELE